jgi:hypothetical protein
MWRAQIKKGFVSDLEGSNKVSNTAIINNFFFLYRISALFSYLDQSITTATTNNRLFLTDLLSSLTLLLGTLFLLNFPPSLSLSLPFSLSLELPANKSKSACGLFALTK